MYHCIRKYIPNGIPIKSHTKYKIWENTPIYLSTGTNIQSWSRNVRAIVEKIIANSKNNNGEAIKSHHHFFFLFLIICSCVFSQTKPAQHCLQCFSFNLIPLLQFGHISFDIIRGKRIKNIFDVYYLKNVICQFKLFS